MRPFQSKTNSLRRMREMGVEVGTILDVGVHEQTPELREVFPDKRHLLFEPADDFYTAIRQNYSNLDYEIIEAAVSDFDGIISLKKDRFEGKVVTHSRIAVSDGTSDMPKVQTVRLDTFLRSRNEARPYFLKIDVDSVELEILSGCEGIFKDVDVIAVEVTQPTLFERFSFLQSKGYQFFDLVDAVYNHGMFYQADLIVVSARVMSLDNLRPWQTKPFDWAHWVPTALYESMIQV